MSVPAPAHKSFISAESLLRDAMELGLRVVRSGFRPSFLAALWRGGAPVGIAVQEVLEFHGIPTDHIAIRTSAYAAPGEPHPSVRVHAVDYLVSRLAAADQLLLIDDVFESGRSLEAVLEELERRCGAALPQSIRIATVYYKPEHAHGARVPDYYVRTTSDWLVFPHELHGLSREEILAHKPVGPEFFAPR